MRTTIQRLALLAVVMGGLLVMALSAPASAATTQISGVGVADTAGTCDSPPEGYAAFTDFTLVMTGSLEGCWYSKIDTRTDHGAPSGVYHETGREVFVGSLNGGPAGTFATNYKFESKWDPVATGSGTGGFAGATGRVDFKDEVSTGRYLYRGHIKLG
jgi:hypothetical protein